MTKGIFELKYEQLQIEVLQAEKNKMCKMMLDNADLYKGDVKFAIKGMIAIAYDQGLTDGYKPKQTTTRV